MSSTVTWKNFHPQERVLELVILRFKRIDFSLFPANDDDTHV